jgi:hypothetical protein
MVPFAGSRLASTTEERSPQDHLILGQSVPAVNDAEGKVPLPAKDG